MLGVKKKETKKCNKSIKRESEIFVNVSRVEYVTRMERNEMK